MRILDRLGFSPKQQEYFHNATKPINIAHGAIRAAKTDIQIFKYLTVLDRCPGRHVAMGADLQTLKQNILYSPSGRERTMEYWLGPAYDFNEQSSILTVQGRNGEASCRFVGFDNARAVRRILGGTFESALIDELRLAPKDVTVHLTGRTKQIFATTNPDSPYHYAHTDYIKDNSDVYELSFVMDDNPSLTDEYKARMRRQYSGVFYDRFISGKWVVGEGLIYVSYNPSTDYNYELIPFTDYDEIILGIDYGTAFPFVIEEICKKYDYQGRECMYYNNREYWWDPKEDGKYVKADSDYVKDLKQFMIAYPAQLPVRIFCDETAHSFIAEARKQRINITPASVRNPTDRVRQVDSLYKQGMLRQHKRTVQARAENTTYCWDEKKADSQHTELPKKENDHAVNARDYALYMDYRKGRPGNVR